MNNLWLVLASLTFFSLAYLLLKKVLVKWACKTFLAERIQLAQDHQSKADDVKVVVTEREVMELSLLVLTWLVGAATAVVSARVMMETRHDTLYARSTLLIQWSHFAAPYYIIDTYAMTAVFMRREDIARRRTRAKCILFFLEKWPFLLHHVFIAVGYPVIVNDHWRGYKGDFYAGALLGQDFSNPLLANAKILKILGMTRSTFYALNGAFLVLIFLIARVFFVPITVSIYAAQYHHWDLLKALGTMKPICHLCNFLQFSFQLYWFILLVRLARVVVGSWSGGKVPRTGSKRNGITERTQNFKQD